MRSSLLSSLILCILIYYYYSIGLVHGSKNFTYYVEVETAVNPASGNTYGLDYFISTVNLDSGFTEAPALTLVGGDSYTFCLDNSNSSLYFQICQTDGCGASANNTASLTNTTIVANTTTVGNVTTIVNNITTTTIVFQKGLHVAGDCFTWIPPVVPPGQAPLTYYYGDYSHAFMGNSITVIPASICDRNVQRLNGTTNADIEFAVIQSLVLAFAFGSPSIYAGHNPGTGNFVGAFTSQSVLGNFFNGTDAASYRNGTHVNFTATGTPQTVLIAQLTKFFGNALGCTGDFSTTFPPYVGTLVNLNLIHAGLPIGKAAFDAFVLAFLQALDSYSFSVADKEWVSDFLDQYRYYCDANNPYLICNQPDCLVAAVPSASFDCITFYTQASSDSNYWYKITIGLAVSLSAIIAFTCLCCIRKTGAVSYDMMMRMKK